MQKLTKIVATVSDQRCDRPFLKALFEAGVNVVRLNTAHQDEQGTLKIVRNVRAVSKGIPLLLDTKGPEIRTTKGEEPVSLQEGMIVRVVGNPNRGSTSETLCVTYDGFAADVPAGSRILIDDGEIELLVREKCAEALICVVQNGGVISGRKSVNIPGVGLNLPSLSAKDREYVRFAIEHDIDFIAHSFVRNKEDVLAIQQILDEHHSRAKIIAKIENQAGVDHLPEILDHAYGVMVARGDLGIEIAAERIPIIQKQIIRMCLERNKTVITATQMLHSMIKNPRPTRAEVSDVANAVFDGTDAVMLSGETAYGSYPLEAVRTMAAIAKEVEADKDGFNDIAAALASEPYGFLALSAVLSTVHMPVQAIVIDTVQGNTARKLASFRGSVPVYAQCGDPHVARALGLSYGVYAEAVAPRDSHDPFIKQALGSLTKKKLLRMDDLVTILAGNFRKTRQASFLEVTRVSDWLKA
jgi:pyruvate kinase